MAIEVASITPSARDNTSRYEISGNFTASANLSGSSFSTFAREHLMNLPNVKDLHTSFSLGEVKASSTLPLGHLQRQLTPNPLAAAAKSRPRYAR